MPKTTLPSISEIKEQFSQFTFTEHEVFHWSPKNNSVYYNPNALSKQEGIFQLFHELGHALSGHTNYTSGIQLLKIETEAWGRAQELAALYSLTIPSEQIERCLDSYRDWLYLRSRCPTCETTALETDQNTYHCFNCMQNWKVPSDQRSRHYRLKQVANSK
jgi:hypothetical protein